MQRKACALCLRHPLHAVSTAEHPQTRRRRAAHLEFMRPKLQKGGIIGRPMICVSWSSTSNGVGPMRKYRSMTPPVTCHVTRVSVSDTSMPLLFSSTIPCAVPSAHTPFLKP